MQQELDRILSTDLSEIDKAVSHKINDIEQIS
jgi:hypothetical protein